MITVRYTAWDGSQRVRLHADQLFEKLGEYLSRTDDLRQALDWMLRHGVDLEGSRVMGLDEFLEDIREQIRKRYQDFNLKSATGEVRQRLDELLDLEREALEELGDEVEKESRRAALDQLPNKLSEALERLRGYDFAGEQARREFDDLVDDLDDIRDLEEFVREYGDLFRGPQSLGYQDALDLMREMRRLRRLQEELLSGEVGRVDLEALREMLGQQMARDFETLREVMATLEKAGYLLTRENRVELSPKGVRKIGQLALRDIYQGLLRDRSGGHRVDHRGLMEQRIEATRAYQFGEPLQIDLVTTLKKALRRRPGVPLQLEPGDFEVFESDHATSTSTVLLLDMSWSMSWEGRFAAAKRVAMALESLIRSRFPRDYFAIVGFFTRAVELKLRDLPEASWNMGDPFTNLQDGLRLAGELLTRHPSSNSHIIVITDGQPTAYFSRGRLHCEWPLSFGGISVRAAQETLKEVARITRRGVKINTFMLDDSPSLRAFVERMTHINKGRAFYTRPDRLGEYLLVDYIGRKRKRV